MGFFDLFKQSNINQGMQLSMTDRALIEKAYACGMDY